MPIFEMTNLAFRALDRSSFADLGVRERDDLQRLLRTQIDVIGDDLYVVSEEFGDWEGSSRRIDLLAIDPQANLVVIELKRTIDGGHMELQAIRYASMISAMTFERAAQIHGDFLARIGEPAGEARTRMLEFLDWEEPDEERFGTDVRIILVSEDFGKELTTAVLWLRERDLDIRCVRLRPYRDGDAKLIDVQQIIPLPEINEYQIQLKEKGIAGRKSQAARYDERFAFWQALLMIAQSRRTRHANISPGAYSWIGASSGVRGLSFNYTALQKTGGAELYIDRGNAEENKQIFDQFLARKEEIERICGVQLSWERLDEKRASRVKYELSRGGYRSPEAEWAAIHNEMVEAMTKLENALQPGLDELNL